MLFRIFKIGTKFDKDTNFYANPSLNGSFFNIPDTRTALARRSLFSSSFSMEAIRNAEPLIMEVIDKFFGILHGAALEAKVVDLEMGFRCLTSDSIMTFMFQNPLGVLDAPDFQAPFISAIEEFSQTTQWPIYFPKIFSVIFQTTEILPSKFIEKYLEPLALTQWLTSVCHEYILDLKKRSNPGQNPTIFDNAIDPNTEKRQVAPSTKELAADAFLLMLAGTDTTSFTLSVAVFNILSKPRILEKLRSDLREAIHEKNTTLGWASLEKLPYLRAIIKESLRCSHGAPGRLPRVVPSTGAILCGQEIPPGTRVSGSNYVYNNNPDVFPDPLVFRPERWLVNETTELEKNMISFSRGSRNCLGMNLAYAELNLVLAHLFRRFDLELYQTTSKEVEWKDCYVPVPKGHLKVLVTEAKD
ncbi:hypothetical protein MMC28_008378 [Mycoblastus sanguinarius]|nr:hypothetical protein [Mycoblastus sanguinarius]